MLILLSPAKTLDFDSLLPGLSSSLPDFVPQSVQLIDKLRSYSPARLAKLMHLSDKLAALNVARNLAWSEQFTTDNSRPAVFAFRGDVYQGLEVDSLSAGDLRYAQEHLRILSGLYGLLRPLDRIQPYRLEMGTALPLGRKKNLYSFWGERLAEAINMQLEVLGTDVLVNLASVEYFRAADRANLRAELISPVFKDKKNGSYKVISFFAKKARGLMARWIVQQRAQMPADLQHFDLDGYRYSAAGSTPGKPVFLRDTGS